ncbi:MAG: ribose-5-phosphate isomerase RpiA [Hyphomicrobiaceae bacterium]
MSADDYKQQAAAKALEYVRPGMKIGLGTGSTAAKFVDLLGAKVKAGLDVVCVPTSEATAAQARALGIRLTTLDEEPVLDLTVDGADELDSELRLIKGGGGALLREKIVAVSSDRMIVISDISKRVDVLGKFPVPVEVVRFGLGSTKRMIEGLAEDVGCAGPVTLRMGKDGQPFVTDSGNYILDCAFDSVPDPESLDDVLRQIPGVVESGLFLGICDTAILAGPDGVEVIEAEGLPFDLFSEDDA